MDETNEKTENVEVQPEAAPEAEKKVETVRDSPSVIDLTPKKVADLDTSSKRLITTIKVVEKKEDKEVQSRNDGSTHRVADFLVGDETGVIIMSLWDDNVNQVEVGQTYVIENARVTVFQRSMRLALSREGKITLAAENVEPNMDNNVSDKEVENPRRFFRREGGSGGFGGGRGGGFRGGRGGRDGGFRGGRRGGRF